MLPLLLACGLVALLAACLWRLERHIQQFNREHSEQKGGDRHERPERLTTAAGED